jgi:hypothetical protein
MSNKNDQNPGNFVARAYMENPHCPKQEIILKKILHEI